MCGIMGYIGNGNAVPVIIDGLSKLEYRGYDSAGIAMFKTSQEKKHQPLLADKNGGQESSGSAIIVYEDACIEIVKKKADLLRWSMYWVNFLSLI